MLHQAKVCHCEPMEKLVVYPKNFITMCSNIILIDRASLAEKSATKDEKTLCWPPLLIAHLVTKLTGNKTAQI